MLMFVDHCDTRAKFEEEWDRQVRVRYLACQQPIRMSCDSSKQPQRCTTSSAPYGPISRAWDVVSGRAAIQPCKHTSATASHGNWEYCLPHALLAALDAVLQDEKRALVNGVDAYEQWCEAVGAEALHLAHEEHASLTVLDAAYKISDPV